MAQISASAFLRNSGFSNERAFPTPQSKRYGDSPAGGPGQPPSAREKFYFIK
jgi:hypothetical protein